MIYTPDMIYNDIQYMMYMIYNPDIISAPDIILDHPGKQRRIKAAICEEALCKAAICVVGNARTSLLLTLYASNSNILRKTANVSTLNGLCVQVFCITVLYI